MPDDIWHSWLCVYFRNRALPTQEAHDCAHEAFLRYTQHAEAPAWNDGNPPALLWQIAHDVLCEYCRQRDRHARLQQRLIEHQRCVPPCDVEVMAIDAVECERFMAFFAQSPARGATAAPAGIHVCGYRAGVVAFAGHGEELWRAVAGEISEIFRLRPNQIALANRQYSWRAFGGGSPIIREGGG